MAISTPPQPTPHPEVSPQSKPELKDVKPPDSVKLDSLETEFNISRSELDRERSMLKTAQRIKVGCSVILSSPECLTIDKRLRSGESIEDIEGELTARVNELYEIALDKELSYQEANVSLLRSEVGSDKGKRPLIDQALRRIEEIKTEKEVIANRKQREEESAVQQKLQQVRQQLLESRQPGSKDLSSETLRSSSELNPEVIAEFKHYIYQGGLLIRQGRYAEAMVHFRNKAELAKVGRRIVAGRDKVIDVLPQPEKYWGLADAVARYSWNREDRSIELSNIAYYLYKDGRPRRQILPPELQHEISLIYMEEWLHTLQEIQGEPLAGQPDREIDVAAYMEKNGIPMTKAFLGRYERAKALEKARQA